MYLSEMHRGINISICTWTSGCSDWDINENEDPESGLASKPEVPCKKEKPELPLEVTSGTTSDVPVLFKKSNPTNIQIH